MTDTINSAIASVPETAKVLLQFNKISGAPTGVLSWVDPATLNNDFYVYVEYENFSFQDDEVRGVYPNYEVVNRVQAEVIYYESEMDMAAQQKITKAYPVINQVNNIGNAIVELGSAVTELLGDNVPAGLKAALEKLAEMNAYITEVKDANNVRKVHFANAPGYKYVSLAEEAAMAAAQLEGGLHEFYGAKEITGGTVF